MQFSIRRRSGRKGRDRIFIDFSGSVAHNSKFRYVYSDNGFRIQDDDHARRIVAQIEQLRNSHGQNLTLEQAVERFRGVRHEQQHLIRERLRAYFEELEGQGLKRATIEGYRNIVNNHLSWWDSYRLDQINFDTLAQFKKYLVDDLGLNPRTAKRPMQFLKTFYRNQRQYFPDLPDLEFPSFTRGQLAQDRVEKTVLPVEQVLKVIDAVPEDDRGYFLMCLHTARPNEVRAVLVGDYAEGVVTIQRAAQGGGSSAEISDTKTGDEGDYKVITELREWIEARITPEAKLAGRPLFPNPRTGKMYRKNTLLEIWKRASTEAGVDYCPPRDAMRHGGATALAEAGVALEEVQALLRHSDLATTQRHYLVKDTARRTRGLEHLAEMIAEARGK